MLRNLAQQTVWLRLEKIQEVDDHGLTNCKLAVYAFDAAQETWCMMTADVECGESVSVGKSESRRDGASLSPLQRAKDDP